MTTRLFARSTACFTSLLALLALGGAPSTFAESQQSVAGIPAAQALRLGEAMYRGGMLPSGKPMRATVQGDLELDGTMSTCANCHLRSGLGALEGGIFSPPTNGPKLYAPLRNNQDIPGSAMKRSMFKNSRPAYTDASLALMLRFGTAPTGEQLSETMPRYTLNDSEMEILIYYLKNLSARLSPGVTDAEIRFATVVTEEVTPQDREALLQPLKVYIQQEWNPRVPELDKAQTAQQSGSVPGPGKKFRKIALDVWELKGAPGTWGDQLAAFYRTRPVFAVLGGITTGPWQQVHDFCEKNQIPCTFPITDLPVVSDTDWYTLYFSKGYYQEGEAAAKYLSRVFALPADTRVVQVYRDSNAGNALSGGFAATWAKLGSATLINESLPTGKKLGADFWAKLALSHPNAVLLLWLGPADLAGIEAVAAGPTKPSSIILSSTLLEGSFQLVPDTIRELALLTYPVRLPGDGEYARSVATGWLAYKKIPTSNLAVSAKAYFVTRMLSRVLLDMGDNYYRDYFLDTFDDGKDQSSTSVVYPQLSFGPGQRYSSKGCYLVTLTKGDAPKVVRQSDWVIY
jgi:hypothetical protein